MVGTFAPKVKRNNNTQKIFGIVCVVLSIALFLTTFIPFLRVVGKFLIGSLGVFVYVILAAVFLLGLALIMHAKYKFTFKYILYNILVVIAIVCILHLIFSTKFLSLSFKDYVLKMYNSWTVGGVVFGIVCYGLKSIISIAGTYVFFVIFATIFIALIIDYKHAYKQFMRIKQKNLTLKETTNLKQGEINFRAQETTDVKVKPLMEEEPTLITLNNKKRERELSKEELEKRLTGNTEIETKETTLEEEKDKLRSILGLKTASSETVSPLVQDMTCEMLKEYMRAPKTVTLAPSLEQQKEFLHATLSGKIYNNNIINETKTAQSNQTLNLNDNISAAFNELRAEQNRPAKIFDDSIKPILGTDNLYSKPAGNNFNNNIETKQPNSFNTDFLSNRRKDRNETNILPQNAIIDNIEKTVNVADNLDIDNLVSEKPNKDSAINAIDDIINQIKKENANIISSKFSSLNEEVAEEQEDLVQEDLSVSVVQQDVQDDESGFVADEEFSDTGDSEFDFKDEIETDIEAEKDEEDNSEKSDLVSNFKKNFMEKMKPQAKQQSLFDMEVEETAKAEPNFGNYTEDNYVRPGLDLLKDYNRNIHDEEDEEFYREKAHVLEETLANFNVPVRVVAFTRGPAVTRYELQMAPGVSVKKIQAHESDIAMGLESSGNIRIEAPIPGKNAVGIEIPNREIQTIGLKDVIGTPAFAASNNLSFGLGKDISGQTLLCNIDQMPHLLIAGSTGTGKSVCLNALLASLLFKHSPADLKIILIDPKRVEFGIYSGIPHLVTPEPIIEPKEAINALKWAVEEMERRYSLFHECKVNNISLFNSRPQVKSGEDKKLPNIVIVIDELANLISLAKRDVEEYIKRLTSLARASGIYLVVATQRPSVDVITGTIKVNIPSRIAFAVTSGADSKTILDSYGAENLLGKGDMLYSPQNYSEPKRVQGSFISQDETKAIVDFIKENNDAYFDEELVKAVLKKEEQVIAVNADESNENDAARNKFDVLLPDALKLAIENRTASISMIQRRFAVGYSRAARIIDQMELAKFISPSDGSKSRSVYLTMEEYNELFNNNDKV